MNTNKKTIIFVVGILAIIALFWAFNSKLAFSPTATSTPQTSEENNQTDEQSGDTGILVPEQTLPFSNAPKDVAWAVFQKYLSYNKDKNLEGVKSVVYKVAPVCEDSKTRIDCEARMGSAYSYGSALKKEDFTNVWNDEKQIILSTDFWLESAKDLDQYGRFRSILFFVKGADNNWKLLSFSPYAGGAVNKGAASQEEIDSRLIIYTEDNDKDGMADYEEECLNKPNDSTCIKTSPKLRDTDGDGLWDSVEALMNSMK